MKKIGIISQYYKPEMGAPQNRLSELAIGLKNYGWEVSIFTTMPNYPVGKIFKEYSSKLFLKENMDGMEVRRYWSYASNSRKSFPRIVSMLTFSSSILFSARHIKKSKFDFLIVESPPLTLGVSGYILSRFSKVRFVLNVSDLWPLSAKELGAISNGFFYRKLEELECFLYKKAFICLGQSQEIVDYIISHGSQQAYLFRNGVDPQRFLKDSEISSDRVLKIVYTGLLGVAQGILDICKKINFADLGVQFHIYGAGIESQDIEIFLKQNPDRGVFYHGVVDSARIPDILRQYSATLIALVKNIYGAVPSKIYESMAAGLPILFSGEGEGKVIIEKYDLGWTSKSRDYKSLERNIKLLCTEEENREEKSKNCISAASSLFNRPNQIERLHHFFLGFI